MKQNELQRQAFVMTMDLWVPYEYLPRFVSKIRNQWVL